MGRAVKNSLEISIEQMRLEGGLEGAGRMRVAEYFEANCSRQMGQHKKKIFHQMFCVYTGGEKGLCVRCRSQLSCWSIRLKEIGQILRGCSRDGIEADS